jgi:hypothetical protein
MKVVVSKKMYNFVVDCFLFKTIISLICMFFLDASIG